MYQQQQPQHQPRRRISRGYRGNGRRNQFYARPQHQQPGPMHQHDRVGYDVSDNEYNGRQENSHSQQQHSQRPPMMPKDNNGPVVKRMDELARSFQGHKTDFDELRTLFSKLTTELDTVKTRLRQLESATSASASNSRADQIQSSNKEGGDTNHVDDRYKRKKKLSKARDKRASLRSVDKQNAAVESSSNHQPAILNQVDQQADNSDGDTAINRNNARLNRRTGRDRYDRRPRRERPTMSKPVVAKINQNNNDDSTTQADVDDDRENADAPRVARRKKPQLARRGRYGNRHRRQDDSSERNSNDTSPQNDRNGKYPELSKTEIEDIVRNLKSEFESSKSDHKTMKSIKATINQKGPQVAHQFAFSILEYAICDVTSPTKISEIADNLYQLLVSEDNKKQVDFQRGFYEALSDVAQREDDITIDAPRFMDTLGKILAECVIPMHTKHRTLIKKFVNKSIEAYKNPNLEPTSGVPSGKTMLLVNTLKAIASSKDERFAKSIWNLAQLKWDKLLDDKIDLNEFVESNDIRFTLKEFSPQPETQKRDPKELEKFADEVTNFVEQKCAPQKLNDLVRDLNLETSADRIDYYGTLIYAIVRGCLASEPEYKLDNEALEHYASILGEKRENQVEIAVKALSALTKLWHQYSSPQDLIQTILQALHNKGTAPFEALDKWLNSDTLKNVSGIGAARLCSKRYIEDLGATLKS